MDAQMAAESVPGAAGNQRENGPSPDQRPADLVDRAVPPDCHHSSAALGQGGASQLGRVAGMLR